MKDHHKEFEQLQRVAERAIRGDSFLFLRKLQPHLVKELAIINDDKVMVDLADKAHGKRITSAEGIAFTEAAKPSHIAAMCKKALAILNEENQRKNDELSRKKSGPSV